MTEQDVNKLASKIIADVTGIAENSISSINFNSLDVSVKEGMSTTLDAIKNFLSITTDDNFKGLLLTTVGDRFELKLLPIKFLKLRRLLENNVLKLYDNNVGIVVFDKVENCYVKAADILRKSGNPLNAVTIALTGSAVNSMDNSNKEQTSAKKERDYDKEFKDDLSETFRVANLITAGLNKLGKLMKNTYSNITFTKVADSTILLSHMQQNMMTKGSATQPIAYIGDYELSLVVNAGLWYTKVCGIFNDFCFLCVRDTRVKDDSYLTAEDLNLDPNDIDLCTLAKRLLSIGTSAASVTDKDKNQIIDVLKSQAYALRATLACNKENTIELSAQEKETLEKALEITENYLSKIRSNSSDDDDETGRMKIFK